MSEKLHSNGPAKADTWAWGVCWLMFASTVLNYMDRQTVTLVGGDIRQEFELTQEGFGWVLAAFQLSYAAAQIPAGFLADRWDVRWTYAFAVAWWSLAGIAGAFSPTLGFLMVFRALLGFGESFNWPCALKVTGRILPASDRSLGNGIFNSGAAIGAVLTPLTVPWLALKFGWRTTLIVVGALGFVWVLCWLIFLRDPRAIRMTIDPVDEKTKLPAYDELTPSELDPTPLRMDAKYAFGSLLLIPVIAALTFPWVGKSALWWAIALMMLGLLAVARILPLEHLKGSGWAYSLGEIVRGRRFRVMAIVSISINVCWHFLVNWLPTYLQTDRKMTMLAGGMLSSIPFLAADAGNVLGGGLARWLSKFGGSPDRARLKVMGVCVILISSGTLVNFVEQDAVIMVLLGVMALGTAAFMANYFAFTQEVSSKNTGLIVGFLGALGNLFAAGFLPVVGWIKDTTGGFGLVFGIVGLLPIVGWLALIFGWGWATQEEEPA